MATALDRRNELIQHYVQAKNWVRCSPFVREVEWQNSLRANFTETEFLREYAWVVLNSGFREAIIRKHFSYISLCFCDWESASAIVLHSETCVSCATSAFGNKRKLWALVETARAIENEGFEALQKRIQTDTISAFESLPFIGATTKFHLAKNLGLDVAKPDRHLLRLAERFGYSDVQKMCRDIFEYCGDKVAVADLVLWRFEERTYAQ
ncbi:MAG: hypothetical protein WCE79_03510 [Xanthobacteraceae bacterium]